MMSTGTTSLRPQPRILLATFILIVICTLVSLVYLLFSGGVSFQTRESSPTPGWLIAPINRHLQDENNNRAQIQSEYGNDTSVRILPKPMVQGFQKITDVPEKLYLYSAFYDLETQSVKLIGGARSGGSKLSVFCQFYNQQLEFISSHEGRIEQVETIGAWASNVKYAGSFVICPLHQTDYAKVPTYVSISTGVPNLRLENIFRISNQEVKAPELEFALCVQPVFNYEQPLKFLEWIEFYKLMGVQAFTFYNMTIGPKTSCVMRAYSEAGGGVEILKWNLLFKPDVEIAVHGQVMQVSDCIFRQRGRSKYVVIVDLDEMLMPTTAANYKEMLSEIIERRQVRDPDHVSNFKFRNGFFRIDESLEKATVQGHPIAETTPHDFNDNTNTQFEDTIKEKLIISKFIREAELWGPDARTKYIAVPNLIRKPLVHSVRESKPGTYTVDVPPEIGYLHHYRQGLGEPRTWSEAELRGNGRILEKSADRFRSKLSKIVAVKLRQLSQRCDLDLENLI